MSLSARVRAIHAFSRLDKGFIVSPTAAPLGEPEKRINALKKELRRLASEAPTPLFLHAPPANALVNEGGKVSPVYVRASLLRREIEGLLNALARHMDSCCKKPNTLKEHLEDETYL